MDYKHSRSSHFGFLFFVLLSASLLAFLSFNGVLGATDPLTSQTWWKRTEQVKRAVKGDLYLLGVGKADITGPIVELNFMGYASLAQIGTGLRQRIFARAFIIGSTSTPADRFIYLNIDTSCGDTAIRNGILEGVTALGSNYSVYGQQNVAVVGTHQHSGPGAFMNYLLPQITSLGFNQQSYQAIVDGSVLAVKRAHESLTPGYLAAANTTVTNANINRSLYAYLANPASERAQYEDNVEKTMTMLRFQRASDGKNIGLMTWFPVHGTSALENNTHVTGDNKGVAQYLFEKSMVGDDSAADGFVAGFSQASVGDTTPNVLGAWCDDGSGRQCTLENSTCGGRSQACHGRGPLFDKVDLGISSCYEIGKRQFEPALDLYISFDAVATPIKDSSVKAFHFFQDMQYFKFQLPNGNEVQTCPAALGYGFAAGTTDGPGAFDFTQNASGAPNANPLWSVVSGVIKTPTPEQKACQEPKPILLDVGEISFPYAWTPNIVDIQMFRVGQMLMVISPSEVTTMSGRRWKSAIAAAAQSSGIASEPLVVLGSPANTYAHYVTTPEEYSIQRYEGASTLYGQWELPAYINLTVSNLHYLFSDASAGPPQGTLPPDNRKNSLNFISPVVQDNPDPGKKFGDIITPPRASYSRGEVVNATFVAANPRNSLRLEGTYVAVEQLQGDNWTQIRDDWDWFLSLTWIRDNGLTGTSHVDVSWETAGETDLQPGTYRMHYWGDSKALFGGTTPFEGLSGSFVLT